MPARYTFSVWYCTYEAADATNSTRDDSEAENGDHFLCLQNSVYHDTPVHCDKAAMLLFRKMQLLVRETNGESFRRQWSWP